MSAVVTVKILGDDSQLKRTLAGSRSALSAWDKSLNSLGKSGAAMTSVGRNITHGITLPVAAVGVAAVKMAYDFDKSMTRIKTLTDGGAKNMDLYRKSILELGKQTGQAPKDLADGLYYIASSGYSGAKALDILNASAKASAIGMGDTQTIADYATTALNLYGSANFQAKDAIDLLVGAVKEGKGEPADFANQLGKVLAGAKLAGLGIKEVVGVVTELTNLGQPVDKATTSIDNILGVLAKPSASGLKMFKTLGLDAKSLRQELQDKGLKETLDHINGAIHGQSKVDPSTAVNTIFSNKRASRGFNAIEGADQKTVNGVISNVQSAKGALDAAFKTWSESTQGKFHKAMGTLKADLTDIGGQLLPTLVDWLDKATKAWSRLDDPTKKQIEKFALIAAAAGPVLLVFGKLLTTFSLIAKHPIITALAVIGTYLVKLYATNETFRNGVNATARALADVVKWINAHKTAIELVLVPLGVAITTYMVITRLTKGYAAAVKFATEGQKFLAAAVWLTNIALDADPVILAIAALAGLAAALFIAYKRSATFRAIVQATWSWIKGHWPMLAEVIGGPIGLAAAIIIKHWNTIKAGAEVVKSFVVAEFEAIERPVLAVFDAIKAGWDNTIGRLHVPAAVSKVGGLLGKVSSVAGSVGNALAGARASGGPVAGGKTYLVGEHGPELFTAGASGSISTAAATAAMFGKVTAPNTDLSKLLKAQSTQKTQYTNAERRYKQLLARGAKTQAQRDAITNAKATADQQKKDYDAATQAVQAAQKADKALQAQYKKGAPLLNKAAALVGLADPTGPVEKQAKKLADAIRKQFADKDGNIPDAAQAAIDRINDLAQQAAAARSGLVNSLTGSSDFVSKFSGQGASSGDISAFLQGQVTKIKRLGSDLKILTARGLPPSMIQQLAAGGLDALSIADALASAPSADLAGIVAAQSQINTLSNALGDSTEAAVFGKPDSPTGDLTGTKIKDAPAGTVNNINITAQTNASAAQIAADAAWHLRTVSA